MIDARQALQRLRDGNERFATNVRSLDNLLSQTQRGQLAGVRQEPFAIILGCSDSRAPAEMVFDQGLGDLFVIRVAGNIVAPSQVGSVEFAATEFGTRLVVVLGHTQCGAIRATVDDLQHPGSHSDNIRSIVNRIRPAVEDLVVADAGRGSAGLIEAATRANVRASADHLRHGSAILEELIARDSLLVVGAEYNLESGRVDFFDGVPGAS